MLVMVAVWGQLARLGSLFSMVASARLNSWTWKDVAAEYGVVTPFDASLACARHQYVPLFRFAVTLTEVEPPDCSGTVESNTMLVNDDESATWNRYCTCPAGPVFCTLPTVSVTWAPTV